MVGSSQPHVVGDYGGPLGFLLRVRYATADSATGNFSFIFRFFLGGEFKFGYTKLLDFGGDGGGNFINPNVDIA